MTKVKDELNFRNPAALSAAARGDMANFMVAATPGGIERQEAQGQQDFVASETLPKRCNYCTREQLEKLGIEFGEDADDLFVRVQLPAGWSKKSTDHSMWSKLVDDKSRERASIFYKAAFYDRDAFIGLNRRYGTKTLYLNDAGEVDYDNTTQMAYVVVDQGKEIYRAGTMLRPAGRWSDEECENERRLSNGARDWLKQNYPDYDDPTAYWD